MSADNQQIDQHERHYDAAANQDEIYPIPAGDFEITLRNCCVKGTVNHSKQATMDNRAIVIAVRIVPLPIETVITVDTRSETIRDLS